MKIIIEDVILSSRFELSDMLRKVDILWIQGELTDEDKDALVKLAQAHATPENSYAPLQQQMNAVVLQLNLLKDRVTAIEVGTPAVTLSRRKNILSISSRMARMMTTIMAIP